MAKWSGLAPAVDSHIRRMDVMKRDQVRLTMRMLNSPTGISMERMRRDMYYVLQWYLFAQSYGMPQPDGSVVPGVVIRTATDEITPYKGADLASGEKFDIVGVHEESTISGREQFGPDHEQQKVAFAQMMIANEVNMLNEAVTHYISGEISSLITTAAESADPEPIFNTDLITPFGFAVLEQPILLPDLDPYTGEVREDIVVAIRAFAWMPARVVSTHADGTRAMGDGIQIITYSTPTDQRNYFVPTYEKAMQEHYWEFDEDGIRNEISILHQFREDDFYVLDVLPWAFGSPWEKRQGVSHEDGKIIPSVAYMRRWFMTLMRFCWQEILVPGSERLPRAAAKRLLRSSKPKRDYTVLRLRRVYVDKNYDEAEAGYGQPLTYRLLVRGHWKRQYCPKLGPARLEDGTWNADSHRLMWIQAYWKGPEDGELGPEHHATAITR